MTDPRCYLFVTFEGGGNVPAVLGAARRLIERGHDVVVLTEPCLQHAVEAIGGRFRPFDAYFVRTDRQEEIFYDWRAKTPMGALEATTERVLFGPAETTARAVDRAIDAESPHALVVDWMLPAAAMVGEARAIPTAILLHCTNMLPAPGRPAGPMRPATGALGRLRDRVMWALFSRMVDKFLPAFNALRATYGLDPLRGAFEQYRRADRVLVQTSDAFDFVGHPDPDNVLYVGPVLDEPDWVEPTPWSSPWPASDPRPLVVVSPSSTFQDQRALVQTAIDALGRLEVRGLVTLGPAMAKQSFDVPDNVVVVESAPHGLVFPHASAFVTHCGHGSVMRALQHGVPLLALPMGRDQDGNATRIVERGVGLAPKRRAKAIAAALQRLLDEPRFRANARALGDRIVADARSGRLREELESLARGAESPSYDLASAL